jgi:hypothetical protein
MSGFEHAFQRLMSRAPGPVFPRARRLYFDKYPLEDASAASPFRTFLLEETIHEGMDGSLTIQVNAFALVAWDPDLGEAASQGPPDPDLAARYLKQQWERKAASITAIPSPWFRTDCAYLKVTIEAIYCSRSGPAAGDGSPDPQASRNP